MSRRPSSKRSADALYRLLNTAVRQMPRDLSLTSLSTLSTLERTGARRITELATIEGVTQPSMTALVAALERRGLVQRRSDPADGRVALIALTDEGAAYRQQRRHGGAHALARLIDNLSLQEAAALSAAVPALKHLCELDNEQRDPAHQAPQ